MDNFYKHRKRWSNEVPIELKNNVMKDIAIAKRIINITNTDFYYKDHVFEIVLLLRKQNAYKPNTSFLN